MKDEMNIQPVLLPVKQVRSDLSIYTDNDRDELYVMLGLSILEKELQQDNKRRDKRMFYISISRESLRKIFRETDKEKKSYIHVMDKAGY